MVGGKIRWGTSSWSEKSWAGSFYPEGTPAGEFLSLYSRRFDTVEADVTYYRIPSTTMVQGWRRKTPEGFRLSAKFPRSIVHAGKGPHPDGEKILAREYVAGDTELFLERMSTLGDRCGPLVLQFPYFNRTAFPSVGPFLERLAAYLEALPKGFRYGVEVRNKAWIDKPLLDLLRAHNVALVLVDLLYMPHPAELHRPEAGEHDLLTADFSYARLIGDRKRVEEAGQGKFDRIVIDQGQRLADWAELLVNVRKSVPETYVYGNNHYAGHGPDTIRDLAQRCGDTVGGPIPGDGLFD
ncbi:MAG: hypothetical protein ACI9K5_001442 [Gammaproteobacteria bacterium]|jgi:uncharacterized protein YecE (DUF72 family)